MDKITGLMRTNTRLFYERTVGEELVLVPNGSSRLPLNFKQCSWLQYYRISTIVCHALQGIPWYLCFAETEGKWKIRTSGVRKGIYICFTITKFIGFVSWLRLTIADINSSHDITKYFDLDLSIIMGYSSFDYPFVCMWLCRMKPVEEFFEELQSSPLLKIASPASTWQVVSYTIFILWYAATYIPYFLPQWGFHSLSWEALYEATKMASETYYGLPQTWEGRVYYVPLLIIGFIASFQQIEYFMLADLVAVSGVVTMRHIAADVDRAVKDPTLTDSEIFELIAAQKKLTRKFNKAFGLMVCTYLLYCSPYYFLHIVDIFAESGWMTWAETSTYIAVLAWTCKMGMDIGIMTKRRQRWMNDKRCERMKKAELVVFLDDIMSSKFCIGSFFKINAEVTGEIVSLLLTVAIIRIQTMGTRE